jgi:hypothetical protein
MVEKKASEPLRLCDTQLRISNLFLYPRNNGPALHEQQARDCCNARCTLSLACLRYVLISIVLC